MLVLSRKPGERVYLKLPDGTQIVVTLVEISHLHKKVRLGFDAPREVAIYRQEILPLLTPKAGGV